MKQTTFSDAFLYQVEGLTPQQINPLKIIFTGSFRKNNGQLLGLRDESKFGSNHSAKLQRLARILKFCMY